MNKQRAARPIILIFIFLSFGGYLSACNQGETVDPTAIPNPESAITVPEDVVMAREAALDYLREIAAIVVPGSDVPWEVTQRAPEYFDGTEVFLFQSEEYRLTISYPTAADENVVYYAALRNQTLDFCWQAFIDANGQVETTDYEELEPELVNPARVHCEENGYTYELRTREDGRICAACVFDAENACNSWDYFHGTCVPPE
jgi:putative hemolysin